jgi:hypothetical protein
MTEQLLTNEQLQHCMQASIHYKCIDSQLPHTGNPVSSVHLLLDISQVTRISNLQVFKHSKTSQSRPVSYYTGNLYF